MENSKTYVFGNEGSNNMLGLLAPLLQQRGLDPNMVMAMMNNGNGFGNQGGWFIWVIFLFFLMGWNRNGFGFGNNGEGGYPLANMLNNDTGRELLMSAIQGNSTAISQLATTLNCNVNAIQGAIQGVSQQICNVGNQVGLSSQQVINAIQQGNMGIAQQLSSCCCDIKTQMASCCCDIKDGITRANYENQISNLNLTNTLQNSINTVNNSVERGFSSTAYATQDQTCQIKNAISDGISKVIAGLTAAEMRELQAIITKQNDELTSFKTAGIIGLQLAPISGAIAALQGEVNSIKCAQPSTVTLPNPCAVAVPSCVAATYGWNNGLFGNFNGYGSWA